MDQRSEKNVGVLWLLFALAFLISLLAINGQSLWIDEALTAWKAKQPTLAGWWHAIVEEKASDLQFIICGRSKWERGHRGRRGRGLPIGKIFFSSATNCWVSAG